MTADFVSDPSDSFEPARAAVPHAVSARQVGRHRRDPDRVRARLGAVLRDAARRPAAAIDEPGEFVVTLLDGLTFAGLLFVVASGFTLIFGLMRTVNMAHGALFLLAAYIAIELQQTMVGKTRNIEPDDVAMLQWVVPLLVGALRSPRSSGVVMQQVFLRWNQGQDLRQAMITIAIAVILADQMLAQYGGLAKKMVVARRRHALHRDLRSALRDRAACSCSPSPCVVGVAAVAVAQPDPDGHRHPCRRRRPRRWSARSASTSPSCSP